MKLTARPLTPERWSDLELIFNAKGCSIARGCWCMYYRLSDARVLPPNLTQPQANYSALKALVAAGTVPGLIGYKGKTPVGWVSLGPREDYAKLRRSPVTKPIDHQPVWSIVCFVIPKQHRGQGVARALLEHAIKYAKKNGATLIEAYPMDKPQRSVDEFTFMGPKSMFDKAGFEEVARRKPQRPVMRLKVG